MDFNFAAIRFWTGLTCFLEIEEDFLSAHASFIKREGLECFTILPGVSAEEDCLTRLPKAIDGEAPRVRGVILPCDGGVQFFDNEVSYLCFVDFLGVNRFPSAPGVHTGESRFSSTRLPNAVGREMLCLEGVDFAFNVGV